MSTYKFEQFNIEIINPVISADVDTLAVQPTKNTIAVNVVLETPNLNFGVRLTDIVVTNLQYQGYENLMERVMERMADFEAVS